MKSTTGSSHMPAILAGSMRATPGSFSTSQFSGVRYRLFLPPARLASADPVYHQLHMRSQILARYSTGIVTAAVPVPHEDFVATRGRIGILTRVRRGQLIGRIG